MTSRALSIPGCRGRAIARLGGVALAALLFTGCAKDRPTQQSLTIGPDPVACADGTPGACLRVTDARGDIWIMGPNEIEGFTYEPGFTYELLVEQPSELSEEEAGAPIPLTLVRVVSKQPAGQSAGTYADRLGQGRWVLTNVSPSAHNAATWAASGITAQFDLAAGRVSGFAGCNDYTAPLTIAGERFEVSRPASTRKACPSETMMALEEEYLTRIAGADAFAITGDQLDLSLSGGGGLQFRAAPK